MLSYKAHIENSLWHLTFNVRQCIFYTYCHSLLISIYIVGVVSLSVCLRLSVCVRCAPFDNKPYLPCHMYLDVRRKKCTWTHWEKKRSKIRLGLSVCHTVYRVLSALSSAAFKSWIFLFRMRLEYFPAKGLPIQQQRWYTHILTLSGKALLIHHVERQRITNPNERRRSLRISFCIWMARINAIERTI